MNIERIVDAYFSADGTMAFRFDSKIVKELKKLGVDYFSNSTSMFIYINKKNDAIFASLRDKKVTYTEEPPVIVTESFTQEVPTATTVTEPQTKLNKDKVIKEKIQGE